MTEIAGTYCGMLVKDARNKIIEDLEASGLIDKITEKEQEVPVSEREERIQLKLFFSKSGMLNKQKLKID